LILPLDADGFIQASGVLVWIGKDRAAARERKGKTGYCCVHLSPFRQNIEQLEGEVENKGMARCSASLCSALYGVSLALPLPMATTMGVWSSRASTCPMTRRRLGVFQSSMDGDGMALLDGADVALHYYDREVLWDSVGTE
jgi:hypothetical protein